MKISKLFHWLYAFLMLLPCAFVATNMFYYGFNKDAVSQEYRKEDTYDEIVYYDTNEISSPNDFIAQNAYLWVGNTRTNFSSPSPYMQIIISEADYSRLGFSRPYLDNLTFKLTYNGSYAKIVAIDDLGYGYGSEPIIDNISFPFVCVDVIDVNRLSIFLSSFTSYSTYIKDIIPTIDVTTYTNGIVDSLNEAVNRTFELSLFSWANNSFIAAPFEYLSGLFGIDSNNAIVLFLDYWATISIIYLCFDLIMYVPLLAHRWIDKAVIE